MTHRYTATVYCEDGTLTNSGDDLDNLVAWINSQTEASSSDLKAEIYDTKTQKLVKNVEWTPPDERV